MDAVEVLRKLYVKPSVLFAHRESQFRNLGKCSTVPIERRKWLTKLLSKLNMLKALCEKHGIVDPGK